MKIGLVCPYSFDAHGGVQNHVRGLAGHLRDAGHEPEILAPGRATRAAVPAGVGFTSAGAAVPVPYNGSVARVNFGARSAARVRRWLQAHRFDLVHLHEPITPSISLLALWSAQSPLVATFHTATPGSRSMRLAGSVLQPSIDKITAGIAVSEPAREVVVRYLGRMPQIVPNGISWADFPTADSSPAVRRAVRSDAHRRAGRRPRIVFLGRLDESRKGLPVLLRALPAIRAEVPDVEVVLAGQGSVLLPPGCRAVGAIDDSAKAALLRSADVFVAPHLERESFGIVLLEAMAAGAAVVASALPAFTDLLLAPPGGGQGRFGATVPPGDPAALAAAVVQAIRHPDDDRLGRAVDRARSFDWSSVGPAVVEVYRAALAGPGRTVETSGAAPTEPGTTGRLGPVLRPTAVG